MDPIAQASPVDADEMLDLLIEEYGHMGWSFQAMGRIFTDPSFQAPYGLRGLFGAEEIERRIREKLETLGLLHPRLSCPEPELPEHFQVAGDPPVPDSSRVPACPGDPDDV
ncbi:MAG: hypothetical protein HY716_08505 [Planctomycetes bacterium]|nr:hypothetical protein [Planctomycetota bacterium]